MLFFLFRKYFTSKSISMHTLNSRIISERCFRFFPKEILESFWGFAHSLSLRRTIRNNKHSSLENPQWRQVLKKWIKINFLGVHLNIFYIFNIVNICVTCFFFLFCGVYTVLHYKYNDERIYKKYVVFKYHRKLNHFVFIIVIAFLFSHIIVTIMDSLQWIVLLH